MAFEYSVFMLIRRHPRLSLVRAMCVPPTHPFDHGRNAAHDGAGVFFSPGPKADMMHADQTPILPPHGGNASVKTDSMKEYLDLAPTPTTTAWEADVLHTPSIPNAETLFAMYPRRVVIKSTLIQGNIAKNWSGGLRLVSEDCALLGVTVRNNVAGKQAGGVLIDNANALFYTSVLVDNEADSHGAAMYVAGQGSVVQIFVLSNITQNLARFASDGSILYSEGTVTFGLGSLITWNGSSTTAVESGELWYVLPAPPGHYVDAFECVADGHQKCDSETYGTLYVSVQSSLVRLSQSYPPRCEAGYYGKVWMDADYQRSEQCYQKCPLSHYCPAGTVTPSKCPAGEFTTSQGMATLADCRGCNTGMYASLGYQGSVSCFPCPTHFTTPNNKGGADHDSCICTVGFYAYGTECLPCPDGAVCTDLGVTLENMVVKKYFWRPSSRSLPGPCPYRSTCEGGNTTSLESDRYAAEPCKRGLRGAFCTLCVYEDHVFDPRIEDCAPRSSSQDLLILVLIFLFLMTLFPFCLEGWLAGVLDLERRLKWFPTGQMGWLKDELRWVNDKLRRAIKKIADPVKLCISFYQVIMNMGTVYRTQVPPAYQDLLSFANRIVNWVRRLRLS
jgi:hypothetical protein